MTRTAGELREEACALQAELDRLERLDWPRWLREADGLTRKISELRRQATAIEQECSSIIATSRTPSHTSTHRSW